MMEIFPATLKEANAFVGKLHRHHKSAQGHKFSIGVKHDDKIVGYAIVGRPVSRGSDNGYTAEVARLVTDGLKRSSLAKTNWKENSNG